MVLIHCKEDFTFSTQIEHDAWGGGVALTCYHDLFKLGCHGGGEISPYHCAFFSVGPGGLY